MLLVICSLTACSPSLREAQDVVAQADSLWHAGQMYGVDAGDSATLAQAYETLNVIPFPFREGLGLGSSYAHACYHYGKLLRAKDNPEEAMQAFINATHSRTRDYHILGRVYNNMGDICHMAEEYALSCDMFEKSSKMYWRNGDTLLYYYCLNDMAFELAEQKEKEVTLKLLEKIRQHCIEKNVIEKTHITATEAYLRCRQYDSVIIEAKQIIDNTNSPLIAYMQMAQAYSYLGVKDSAVFYAQKVMLKTKDLGELNNALYILTHDDDSKDRQGVRMISADRSDIQKLLEIRQGKLSQATQLLEQDLNRKPNWTWLYAIIAAVFCSGGVFYWRYRIRKQQMNTHIEQLVERQADTIIQSIKQHIDTNNLNDTLHWKSYLTMKADADLYMGGIVSKLERKNLNEIEIRFCILTMLDFSLSHIAETIHYGYPSGIKTLKKRISVKLGTTPPELHDFLFCMASNA